MDSENTTNTPTDALPGERYSMVYNPGETLYGAVAAAALANGWTLLPQERGERRLTSRIDGRALKWGRYIERQPTAKEIEHWSLQAPAANGALMMGPTSGNVFCFDIDVVDPELSLAIQDCATERLGYTRFSRIGQKPKIALFYRVETEKDLPKNRAYRFVTANGEGVSEHMLEVQARGKLVTAFGYHHKTERYFEWEGPQPTTYRTDEVPLVTPAQIDSFIEAVQRIRPFHKSSRGSGHVVLEGDGTLEVTAEGWIIPDVPGAVDADTGLIGEGRKQWLSDFGWEFVRHNPELVDAHPDQAVEVVIAHAVKTLDLNRALDLRELVTKKMERDVGTLRAGNIRSFPKKTKRADGRVVVARKAVLPTNTDAALWHLPPADKRKAMDLGTRTPVDANKAAERALVLHRQPIADRVAAEVDAATAEFFDGVYDPELVNTTQPVHVLDAPTGSGKTTRVMHFIVKDPRTRMYDDAIAQGLDAPGPIIFTMPTYNNIAEVRAAAEALKLDPSLSDADLAAQAEAMGLMSAEQAQQQILELRAQAERSGLNVLEYKGKKAAGCHFPDRLDALQEANLSSSGLCHTKGRDGEPDLYCPFYAECDAIKQRALIKTAHVVFLPHAFLSLSIPEDLKNARAVIADERIFTSAIHTTLMPMATFELERKPPPIGKKEREHLVKQRVEENKRTAKDLKIFTDDEIAKMEMSEKDQWQLVSDYAERLREWRTLACEIVVKALHEGKCPAAVLAAHRFGAYSIEEERALRRQKLKPEVLKDQLRGKFTGEDLVHAALRVTGGGSGLNMAVRPDMSDADFAELFAKPTGKDIHLERRAWKIIEERMTLLRHGRAKQSNEKRLQLLKQTETSEPNLIGDVTVTTNEFLRLSWRSELNWSFAPLMLLDASANERIIKKVFTGRAVRMHNVTAPLNMMCVLIGDRSRSTTSMKAQDLAKEASWTGARNVVKNRAVENYLAAVHGNGRLAVAMPKTIREQSRTAYLPPANVDDLHFGAERGLNFAKSHVAAVAFGRMEPPTWVLDGTAAALGYDDDEELILLDPNGDGTDLEGKPLKALKFELVIQMRDGSDIKMMVAMAPEGTWQRIVQIQHREESLRQFAGRLRPVYRGDTPILYLMSQVVPEGIIVDDIVAIDDLIPTYAALLNAARLNNGIIDPHRAFEDRPDLAAKDAYKAMFLSLPAELKAGYHAVKVAGRTVGVPAHFADPLAEVESLYDRPAEMVREATNLRVAPADGRPADKIEDALGSRPQRYDAEIAALERAKEHLRTEHKKDTKRPTYLPGNALYHVGFDKDGKAVRLPLSAIAMLIPAPKTDESEAEKPVAVAMPKTSGLGKMGGTLKAVGTTAVATMTDDDWEAAAAI